MKKKMILADMVIAMSMVMLAGCNSKNSYINDIKELNDMNNEIIEDEVNEGHKAIIVLPLNFGEMVDGLDMKTSEGKKLKSDMGEYAKLLEVSRELFEELKDENGMIIVEEIEDEKDKKKYKENEDDQKKSCDKLEDDVKAFVEAAEDAGVEDDLIQDLLWE